MSSKPQRPSNRRIADLTGLATFVATIAVLGLTGFAVAWLDPGPTNEGPGPVLALITVLGASVVLGVAARALTLFVLRRIRPGGV